MAKAKRGGRSTADSGDPLRQLDDQPWSELWFAYRPAAEEVPTLLRALRGPDATQRRAAARRIAGVHFDEGAFSASAPLASFLVRMLAARDQPDKHELLRALAFIGLIEPRRFELSGGRGRDVAELSGGEEDNPGRPTPADFARAWKTVKEGLDAYLGCLDDADATVRFHAAWLLGFMAHAAKKVAPRLLERALTDADRLVRAHALVALGLVHTPKGQPKMASAIAPLLASADDVVRDAAAVAALLLGADAAEPALAAALAAASAREGAVAGLLFHGGELGELARAVRRESGAAPVADELARLEREVASGKKPTEEAWAAFWQLVPSEFRPVPKRRPASLTPEQRRALELLLGMGDMCMHLDTIGLVAGPAPLRRLLAPSGPLDLEIAPGEPLWCAASDAFAGLGPAEPFVAAALALGPDAALGAWNELVADDPYRLWDQVPAPSAKDHADSRPLLPWKEEYRARFVEIAAELAVRLGAAGEQAASRLADAELAAPRRERVCLIATLALARIAQTRGETLPERYDVLLAHANVLHFARQVPAATARVLAELPAARAVRIALGPWWPDDGDPVAAVVAKAGGGIYFPKDPTPLLRSCAQRDLPDELHAALERAKPIGAAKQPLPRAQLTAWLAGEGARKRSSR